MKSEKNQRIHYTALWLPSLTSSFCHHPSHSVISRNATKTVLPVTNRYYQSKTGTTSQKPVLPVKNRYYQSQTGTTSHKPVLPNTTFHLVCTIGILFLPPRRLHRDNRDPDEIHFRDTRVYSRYSPDCYAPLQQRGRRHEGIHSDRSHAQTWKTNHVTMNGSRPKWYMRERNLHGQHFYIFYFQNLWEFSWGLIETNTISVSSYNYVYPKNLKGPELSYRLYIHGIWCFPTLSGIKLETCLVSSARRFH